MITFFRPDILLGTRNGEIFGGLLRLLSRRSELTTRNPTTAAQYTNSNRFPHLAPAQEVQESSRRPHNNVASSLHLGQLVSDRRAPVHNDRTIHRAMYKLPRLVVDLQRQFPRGGHDEDVGGLGVVLTCPLNLLFDETSDGGQEEGGLGGREGELKYPLPSLPLLTHAE